MCRRDATPIHASATRRTFAPSRPPLGSPAFQSSSRTFDQTLAGTERGDFVYCDPPYAPLSRTSSFAHYTAGGFTSFDQWRLQQAVVAACRRGARVVVSNSSASEIV